MCIIEKNAFIVFVSYFYCIFFSKCVIRQQIIAMMLYDRLQVRQIL